MAVNSQFPNGDKALIVDVDENDALQLSSSLELSGYSVRRAGDLVEALQKFSEFSPGIVLIDASLPAKSWLELIKNIRSHEIEKDSDYRSIILVTTSRFSSEIDQKAKKAGASDVVGKPIALNALIGKITEFTVQY